MKILNLGCGENKISPIINIDINSACNPDIVLDLVTEPLPFKDKEISEVYSLNLFQYIKKPFWPIILSEINRVLKLGGKAYFTFPDFRKCSTYYVENKQGKLNDWEKILYGSQETEYDYVVSIVHSLSFAFLLKEHGFTNIIFGEEEKTEHTILLACERSLETVKTREDVLAKEIFGG